MAAIHLQILAALRALALGRAGYRRFGAWGWARTEEVAERVGRRVPEQLPRLYERGLVDRTDALQPGRDNRPVWLYRINEEGMARAAEELGPVLWPLPPRQEREGGPIPVFLPPSCVGFLKELRRALEDPHAPAHVPGERGWLLTTEIRERGERTTGGIGWFFPEDVALLVRAGLVQRRDAEGGGRPLYLYRVTEAGLQTRILEWRKLK